MREIKFRAWDKDLKAMLPVHQWDFRYPAPHPVMQYTGLKDKNGTEIYEGDIVGLRHKKFGIQNTKVIVWIEHRACFDWEDANDDSWPDGFTGFIDDYEIIGNIYENKELLK